MKKNQRAKPLSRAAIEAHNAQAAEWDCPQIPLAPLPPPPVIEPLSIRSAIAEGMKCKGWKQADFARALNVHRQHVSRMLDPSKPTPNFTLGTLQKIADTLDLRLTVFMSVSAKRLNAALKK